MNISSLICELDPLHRGHKYLLDAIRRDGADCIIACMSGSFTQRGEPALFDKYTRAGAALLCGADLVIELPVTFACAGAERFAYGGIYILDALGIADRLYFGSECGDLSMIKKAALAAEDDRVSAEIKRLMKTGITFAAAREKSVRSVYGDETADILKTPNNILGAEYIKALTRLESSIEPHTLRREGAAHDSRDIAHGFVSATYLRELFISGGDISPFIPERAAELFAGYDEAPAGMSRMEVLRRAMLARLRTMTPQELSQLPDVSEGLENRLYKAIRSECSVEGILNAAKTKRFTMARLKRTLMHAFLGRTAELCALPPQYIRILGFNTAGREALRRIKKICSLPVISTPSKLPPLSEEGRRLFGFECLCDDLYALSGRTISPCGENVRRGAEEMNNE